MKITEMRAVQEDDDGVNEEEVDHRGVAVDGREDEEEEEERGGGCGGVEQRTGEGGGEKTRKGGHGEAIFFEEGLLLGVLPSVWEDAALC